MTRARVIGSGAPRPLEGDWAITAVAPGRVRTPAELEALAPDWIPCAGAMPAASALRDAGRWNIDAPRDFDAEDWWYRCRFPAGPEQDPRLHFEGLATIADAWLNGAHILRSENMFVHSRADVGDLLRADNELVLRFHALGPLLAARRPRPKWRAALVAHQQLRWYRTSLLGRMPAWCPSIAPVGPWRPITIAPASALRVEDTDLKVALDGRDGVVRLSLPVEPAAAEAEWRGTLTVGATTAPIALEPSPDGGFALSAVARLPDVERWWPHTHGPQPLHGVRLSIESNGRTIAVDLGCVGFRALDFDRGADGERFAASVNGVDVFCRGVCWTPLDLVRLDAEPGEYRAALERLRDAGVNMVRIAGTMAYETDTFHDLCDELGILVWQDFMFANMDYPSDEGFGREAALEAQQLLRRLQGRPSLAVVCGGSEVEQQAAMLGLPREQWTNPLFDERLPDLVERLAPGTEWLRSSPTGGTLPFHADRGVSHYYGVGAYLRPFEDARRASVRFAAECLAFSNVPDRAMVDVLLGEGSRPGHHPCWKAAVPRDAGAGWDFEDVRDHYVRLLFGLDPSELRARDPDRYLELGRVATGEAILRTFAEWRRPGSSCRGGLVWFARDLRPGAGWGVVDSTGRPKAAYSYLARAFAPVALLAADEGLNGLLLHAVNDTCEPIETDLRVRLYHEGRPRACVSTALTIPARGSASVHADGLFEGFIDLTYAYRFGPPGHDVVAATLRDRTTGAVLATAHGFPCGLPATRDRDLGLKAHVEPVAAGYALTIETDRFAHAVAIDAPGFFPEDNYFHLEPGEPRRLILKADAPGRTLRGSLSALNGAGHVVLDSMRPGRPVDAR